MRKLLLTFMLLTCVSFVSFGSPVDTGMRALTPAELTASQNTAQTKALALQTSCSLSSTQYSDVYDAEFLYQKQYDRYVVNGVTPSPGQLGNITIQRDQQMQIIMTPAQYAIYLTVPH